MGVVRWLWMIPLALLALGCGPSPSTTAATSASSSEARIQWLTDYEAALAEVRTSGKPLMVDVGTSWCVFCKRLDETVFSRADVAEASRSLVPVRVDADEQPELRRKLGVHSYPTVIFLQPDEQEISRVLGAVPYQIMLDEMEKAAARAGPSEGQ